VPGHASIDRRPTDREPPILHEAQRGLGVLGVWLGMPVLAAALVIVLRDPARMAQSWESDRQAWTGHSILGGSGSWGVVAWAERVRDRMESTSAVSTAPTQHPGLVTHLTQAVDRLENRILVRIWSVAHSYLPMLLTRGLIVLASLPAILAPLAAAWWGTGVAANRQREAAGAFPQASLHHVWWRSAAVCWCAIPYSLVAPIALGGWWIAVLGACTLGTAVSLHWARAHWTTTGGL